MNKKQEQQVKKEMKSFLKYGTAGIQSSGTSVSVPFDEVPSREIPNSEEGKTRRNELRKTIVNSLSKDNDMTGAWFPFYMEPTGRNQSSRPFRYIGGRTADIPKEMLEDLKKKAVYLTVDGQVLRRNGENVK